VPCENARADHTKHNEEKCPKAKRKLVAVTVNRFAGKTRFVVDPAVIFFATH